MKKIFTKNQFAAVLFLALPFLGKSQQTPYLKDTMGSGVTFKTIISANEAAQNGYKMAGIPDGLGAFDNGNGTFTVLMNHEINSTLGAKRAHGSKGAFVSKWIIKKSDLSVISGSDLTQTAKLWNGTSYVSYNSANNNDQSIARFSRFCSADLPEVAAFYNSNTGNGTQERIFMNGEESGAEGRGFAHIVTGTEAGVSYELPYLGKYSWENAVALPYKSDKTVVAGMDDGTGGQVYFYIGTKTNTGTDVQKAGLTNGKVYGVKITGVATEAATGSLNVSPNTTFSLVDLGDVSAKTGAQLEALSIANGVTSFQRPEDGTWNPNDLSEFYFATTNSFANPSRLWKLKFSDISNPEAGGTITAVLDGTEGQKMLDNINFDNNGNMILLEDVGNNAHNGKIWQYTPATDVLTLIAKHDANRFGEIGKAATAPFNQDEETSGAIDVSCILGNGWFLIVDQTHYTTGMPSDIVEGGQFLAMYNPGSVFSAPSGLSSVCAGSSISLSHNAKNGIWSTDYTSQATINSNTGLINAKSKGNIVINYTATNATGCKLSSTKTVTINSIPPVPLISYATGTTNPKVGAPTGGFCVGKTFTLVGSPNSPASSWSATGAISVNTAGLASINSTGSGSIKYTYVDANGCTNSRTLIGTGYTCASKGVNTNIDLMSSDKNFVIYPNPARGSINLQLDKLVGKGQIVVTNLFGKEVKSQNLSIGINTIDINNLTKGFYLVSVVTNEGKSTQKIIVE
ncbi:MAG: T9SS type A sorting domain-containing protein [Chitinophagaceae bacterium]